MTGQDGGYALGVDLGTSNTVAVLRWPDGRTRPLLFDGQPLMPSGALLDRAGRLHVGRDAQRLAQADPARYEPNPKRRIDEPAVLLGDREVPTADLLAGLLGAVARAAVEAVGFLPPAAVTYPASWGTQRRTVLATAVGRAGWPAADPAVPPAATGGTLLVPEPVAAARYFADVLRRPVPVGAALAVFDFGGGTLDIAVVRNEGADPAGPPTFSVIGSGGLAELGGLDLDSALVDHFGTLLSSANPQAWQRLREPQTPAQWRDRRQLWEEVRAAKEMLSRTSAAPVAVPGLDQALHVTRVELERLATPLLRRGVAETASVIASCGLAPEQLAGLFLVGGSSRVPLVARLLHAELGIAPTVLEQPELPVAEGAVVEILPRLAARPEVAVGSGTRVMGGATLGTPRVGVPTPVPGAPISPAPVPGAPISPAPVSGAPLPVSGAPISPALVSGVPAPVPGAPASPAPAGFPPPTAGTQPYPGMAAPPSAARWRTAAIGAGAVLALAGVLTVAVLYFTRDYQGIDFQPFTDVGRIPAAADRPSYADTAINGDRGYVAYQREDDQLEVSAVDLDAVEGDSTKPRWSTQLTSAAKEWNGIAALPDGVVAFAKASSSTPGEIFVLDPDGGRQRWNRTLQYDDKVYLFNDRVVVLEPKPARLVGLDLRTGEQKWSADNPKDQYGGTNTAIQVATTTKQLDRPANESGALLTIDHGDDQRLVQIGADRSARVIDTHDGTVQKRRDNVADPDDLVMVNDDRLYVAPKDGGYQLQSYDLAAMGVPKTLYSAPDDKHHAEALAPCGKQRVCLLETKDFDPKNAEVVGVDAGSDGGERWREPAAGARVLVSVGEHVLAQGGSSDDGLTVYDRDGENPVRRAGVAVRINGGNLLIFAGSRSSYASDPSVAGLQVGSGQLPELGQLRGVRSANCSWTAAVILCPADTDFVMRRFADS